MRRRMQARRQRSGGQLTSRRWQNLRARVIREEPLCQLRLSCCTVVSDTADHIVPVKNRPDLKYNRHNVRGSCRACNMRRGARSLSEVRVEDEAMQKAIAKPAYALGFFG